MENNPIPLKTNAENYNPHDFLQNETGLMEELTVTITLAEYRELVGQLATEKETAIRYLFERDRARTDLSNMAHDFNAQKALCEEAVENGNDLAKENTRLRGEIERQRKIIADLKTRLSNEIRHQQFMEADHAEG